MENKIIQEIRNKTGYIDQSISNVARKPQSICERVCLHTIHFSGYVHRVK